MTKLLQTVFFSQQNMNAANSENDQKRRIYFIINCFRNAVLSFKAKLEQKGEKLKNEDEAGIGQEEFYD